VTDRLRRRLAAAVALIACAALTGPVAGAELARDTLAGRPDRAVVPMSATADDAGVVDITTELGYQGTAAGTGIVVGPGGEVLTNNHVIQGGTRITVTVPGGSAYQAQVLGTDLGEDVAVLQISGAPSLAPATLGDSSQVAVGDPVRAVGNAGGIGGPPSVATGKVTGLNRSITATAESGFGSERLSGLIQTDAPIVPGDSGGPLLSAAGQVIGMDTAAVVDRPGQHHAPEGYAIPINHAIAIVRAIEGAHGSR
jgi:S1-C subfamily serine protease